MIREVEATGKSIDEALAAGYAQLGVIGDELNVSYEIINNYAKGGLFGFRKETLAKVKVMLELPDPKPAPAEKKAEKPAAPKAEAVKKDKPEKKQEKPAPAPKEEKKPAPAPKAEKPAKAPKAAEEAEEVELNIEQTPKVKAAVDYLREVMGLMGVDELEFTAVQKGEATIIKVGGSNVGALIGRRGETMESLSYLASLVANRMEGDYIKLGLDVGGYRGKREQDLTSLAHRIGAKVRKSGRSFAMEPMNPYERRIIHSAITEMEGVRSESQGEGKDRHVVIYSTAPDAQNDNPETERRRSGRRDGNRGGRRDGNGGNRGGRRGGNGRRDNGSRGDRRERGPRPSAVPEREFAARDAVDAAPVAPKRTERVDDFADFGFGKIEL